ncbi:MAG: hypothetical protein U0236_02055 [Nitrospira sp.]
MMIELFVEHGPKDLAQAQAALTAGDAGGVARASHGTCDQRSGILRGNS